MREILFIVVTWSAALVYIPYALTHGSRSNYICAAYALPLAVFALAHGYGKRWGRVGSAIMVFGLLLPLSYGVYQQWTELGFALIPANWMGWWYVLVFAEGICIMALLIATLCWLLVPMLLGPITRDDKNSDNRNA